MSDSDSPLPMPSKGGTYLRDPETGALTLVDPETHLPLVDEPAAESAEAPSAEPGKTTIKRAAKAPAKEG